MSLRLLIGRSGSGKTALCLNEIKERLLENPEGTPIIYLVPEQMTFLSEYRLATDNDLGGMIRAQVYSFSRLAWRILQETGGFSRYHLDSVGLSMLIRKIIEDQKENLKLFQRAADKNGFIDQVEQMITEFKRYCIKPEELTGIGMGKSLQDKLHDLEVIYKHFEEATFGKYIDSEDYFRLLSEKAAASEYLKGAEIYIDGFYSFTPQELNVIAELMKNCSRVTVAVTADGEEEHLSDDLNMFRMSGETYRSVYELAKANTIEIEPKVHLRGQKRWNTDSLRHLEEYFDSMPAVPFEEVNSSVHICHAANRRAEVEGIAREIRLLIREQGYRYKDIALLIRNGKDYHEILEPVFHDYSIPYFIDQKRTMLNHPLIELIRSSIEIINGNWRYEPVFRAVKTELLFPLQENQHRIRKQMDQLENYVLAYGIKGDKWTKKERWIYKRFRGLDLETNIQTDAEKQFEQQLNELRLMITAPILRLSRRLKRADSGRRFCEAVYLFLEELDVPAKLEKWKDEAESSRNLVKSREHDQVWNAVINLLDQYVEILGDEPVSLKQFASIMEAGIESMEFSLIPPAIDQVMIANLEKSRLSEIKVAFVIGANEGVLPAKIQEGGILGDEDREKLELSGVKIGPGSRTRLLDESFLAYKAFVTPSDILYVTYPMANSEGKALLPSSYINRMKDLLPGCGEHFFAPDPTELPEKEQLIFVSSTRTAISYLTVQLQQKKRNYPISDIWWDVYNFYMTSPWKEGAQKVLSSLFYTNRTVQLSKDSAEELYGEDIQASVSRMELFNSCPFSHYVQHGLKLRDRQVYRLEAPDIGELFHAALKQISEMVNEQNITWASLTREQCEKLAKQAVQSLAPRLQNEILLSSERNHYIRRKLEQIITRASFVLSEHAKASGFSPIGLELGFGPQGKLPPLQFSLRNGRKMELIGRIDRVDRAEDDGSVFLRVVDYKSSEKDLNLNEVYYGLALQMLTYLDIVLANSKDLVGIEATPAGVLYFHVHNPMVNSAKVLSVDQIENEILKRFKMNGLMLEDQTVLRLMDKTIDAGDSQIIAAGIKKDGTLKKYSKVASRNDFDDLRHYVREVYKKTGNEIIDGIVDIAPYKMKDKKPCSFCSFKSVCQFDESISDNHFRILPAKSNDEVLESIRKEADSNG